MRLNGRVAFVTGAGGGIGQQICRRFVAEGASVLAADLTLDAAQSATNGTAALPVQCDVTAASSVSAALERAVCEYGRVDILCNVAGGSTAADGPVTDASDDEFWRAIRLDLYGTFTVCKYGLPHLIRAGGGSVINMASMVALTPVLGKDCYTAAKGGVVALTRSMALEFASHRVRVNAIAPGITRTPRIEGFLVGNESMQRIADRHLLGLVDPMDIAHMAVYLASDESRSVTGQVMAVDSGITMR
ncbi:Short-chain dehydrogenase/reductase SDR [Caballeronia calidae]|uniref:Short-chain dehydrogenase/reductase SDR n=1 Tax=Caballeronia calidae TaxID=1777139 RepID=A0A158E5X2_9BURK|nr:SDR family oxidoreductase [Caballeronia calidae]SAL01826.1 Short-chain dehydrogenase/reductase SDR [Caballeronia calidae]